MRGLPSNFQLVNGKFKLTDGTEKCRDNIWFFCVFDKFRVYTSDFGGNFSSLVQKPITYLVLNKTLIVGALRKKMAKYIPNIKVNQIDIGYTSTDRKEYSMMIDYSYKEDTGVQVSDVTFV